MEPIAAAGFHVRNALTRGLLLFHRFCFTQRVNLFGNFFDQDAHLWVGRFEVDRETVMAESFTGSGADGRNDHLLACELELRGRAFLSE